MGIGLQFPIDIGKMSSVLTPVFMPPGVRASDLHEALLARGFLTYQDAPSRDESTLRIGHAGVLGSADLSDFVAALDHEIRGLIDSGRAEPAETGA